MNIIFKGILSLGTILSVSAIAENTRAGDWYASLGIGMTAPIDGDYHVVTNPDLAETPFKTNGIVEWDGGLGMHAALGMYSFKGNNFQTRFEGEVGYKSIELTKIGTSELDSDGSGAWNFLANGYLDFPTQMYGLTPYIGGGAGFSYVEVLDTDDTVFTWQAIAGASFNFTEVAEVYLDYRYQVMDDIELVDHISYVELESHNVNLGVRFNF